VPAPPAVRILRPANAAVTAVAVLVGAYLIVGGGLLEAAAWGGPPKVHAEPPGAGPVAAPVPRPGLDYVEGLPGALRDLALPWARASVDLAPLGLRVVLAALAAFAFAGAGNVRNDLRDVAVDRAAHPDRPLASRAMTEHAAQRLALALYGFAVVAGLALGPGPALVVLAGLVLMEGYERGLKAAGLPGNVTIGVLTGAPFVLGGFVAGSLGNGVFLLALLATFATLGREILKDIEDMHGDLGRRTLPQRIGPRNARIAAAVPLVAAVALSPLPWGSESVLGWSYLPAVAAADAGFLASALVPMSVGKAQRLAKVSMVVALGAFLLGRTQRVWMS